MKCLILKIYDFHEAESGAIVTQNGKMELDRGAESGESKEGSMERSNPTMIQPTSNVVGAIDNVGTHLQGNFVGTSVASLFKEFMTKFRSSLNSQSNLSAFLITILFLIFFIQVCNFAFCLPCFVNQS